MDAFTLAFNAVFPLVLLIALGYILKRTGYLSSEFFDKANQMCFQILLPVNLFNSCRTNAFASADTSAIAFCLGMTLVNYTLSFLLVPRFEPDNRRRPVWIQAMYRGNFVIYGMSVCVRLLGEECVSLTAMLAGLMVPLYNLLAAIALEYFVGRDKAEKTPLPAMIGHVLKNPLLIGPLLGVGCNLIGLTFPTAVNTALTDLGKIATPFALIALGGRFDFTYARKYVGQVVLGNVLRQAVIPLVMTSLAVALGFRGYQLGVILCVFCTPMAVSIYAMTRMMGGDGKLASSLIVTTTCVSCFSIFIGSVILGNLGLL